MKILVLGAGAVGGYFGGRLVQQGSADVTFLVRRRRAQEIVSNGGLTIENNDGQITTISNIKIVTSSDADADEEEKEIKEDHRNGGVYTESSSSSSLLFDVIVMSCKAYSLSGALNAIAPYVHPKVSILPLLNGLAHMDVIQKKFPNSIVWGGTCGIVATLTKGGVVKKMEEAQFVVAGALQQQQKNSSPEEDLGSDNINKKEDNENLRLLHDLIKLMQEAGIDASVSDHINLRMWEKWTFLCTLAACTCLLDGSIGDIISTDSGRDYIEGVYEECNQVATAIIGDVDQQKKRAVYQRVLGNPKSTIRASMSRDMLNGNPTEADHILGDMIQRAKQLGIATPLLSIAYTRLQIYENQRRQTT